MIHEEIINEAATVISVALDSDSITLESNINNTEGWDSLTQLSILTELDDALDGKVTCARE